MVYLTIGRMPTEKANGYQIAEMCAAFQRNGIDTELWYPRRRQPSERLDDGDVCGYYGVEPTFPVRELPNIDLVPAHTKLPGKISQAVFLLHSIIWAGLAAFNLKLSGPGICYARHEAVAFWSTAYGIPTVFEAHEVPRGPRRWLLKRALKGNSLIKIICLTSFIAAEMEELEVKGIRDRVTVEPDAVNLERFEVAVSKDEARKFCGLPRDRFVIGYFGSFQALGLDKGVGTLLAAMRLLVDEGHSKMLLSCVGGDQKSVQRFTALASQLGLDSENVKLLGRVPGEEIPYWLRASDVLTIPWGRSDFSSFYTSPLKLFEYMASSTPIIASALPSLQDVLGDDRNALLVPPGDACKLAEAIVRIANDSGLAQRLAERARTDVIPYTWTNRVRRILAGLPKVLG